VARAGEEVIPVGLTLQPDAAFLDLLTPVIDEADYYEVAPETLWRVDAGGRLVPNGYHRQLSALKDVSGKPFVAHGVGYSMGSSAVGDRARRKAWLARVAEDRRIFDFRWWTDHLGATSMSGLALTLPVPLPMTGRAAQTVRRRLAEMQRVVPDVGVENNVAYFLLGDPLEEPAFLGRVLAAPRTHLLLDLHNVYTMAENFGFDPLAYLERVPLERVIELHVSGGRDSEAGWLPSGRVMRLDGHDDAVPEAVWKLLAVVAPRCPRLRGVTLERMEGTVAEDDVALLADELDRVRRTVNG
jgi:uncharacterized protein (UPF0276 family)